MEKNKMSDIKTNLDDFEIENGVLSNEEEVEFLFSSVDDYLSDIFDVDSNLFYLGLCERR